MTHDELYPLTIVLWSHDIQQAFMIPIPFPLMIAFHMYQGPFWASLPMSPLNHQQCQPSHIALFKKYGRIPISFPLPHCFYLVEVGSELYLVVSLQHSLLWRFFHHHDMDIRFREARVDAWLYLFWTVWFGSVTYLLWTVGFLYLSGDFIHMHTHTFLLLSSLLHTDIWVPLFCIHVQYSFFFSWKWTTWWFFFSL